MKLSYVAELCAPEHLFYNFQHGCSTVLSQLAEVDLETFQYERISIKVLIAIFLK